MTEIVIRPITDAAGCSAVEQLQIDAWQLTDMVEVVPCHMLLTFHKNGGALLGAYADERLVGFVAGFVGLMANGRFPSIYQSPNFCYNSPEQPQLRIYPKKPQRKKRIQRL